MSRPSPRAAVAVFDPLDARRHMAVAFAIDAAADVHPISRYIYGINAALGSGAYANGTLTRAGGNRWTAYNWENNASNAGSDYQYQNDGFLGGGSTPGGAVKPTLDDAASHNAAAVITIPMAGYASADKNGGGDVRNSGADYLSTRFQQVKPRKGAAFSLTPDLSDDFVYQDEFVNWIKTTYAASLADPNKPVWFDLDNEPDLWQDTHAEIHPAHVTYAELIQKSIDYAGAIKDVMPNARVFGPASYGWNGYITLQDAPDRAGRDFIDTYLAQLRTASTAAGRRLVDALDLHWYPEATGGGVRITDANNSAAVVAARLQAPRSLWDNTYTETSWITQYSTHGPINLIPRMKAKIAANNPGTDLAFTEYNYGGGDHISGGIAQADVLGIFGREGVSAAAEWPLTGNEPFVGGAFRMFRNYDGANGTFGDTSVRATNNDTVNTSVYASLDSAHPNVMTVVLINKTAAANPATVSLAGRALAAGGAANVYQLTAGSSAPQSAGTVALGNGTSFTYSMPAYSVTTLRVPLAAAAAPPTTTGSSFNYQRDPNSLTFTFDQNVGASLDVGDLTVTRVGGGSVTATGVTYDAVTNTATFALPTPLPDGNYTARLTASGVTSSGTPLAADATSDFFVLAGDANHDRAVDFNDLLIVSQNYNSTGRTFGEGNLDYSTDGSVDFGDLLLLSQNYNASLPALTGVDPLHAVTPVKHDRVAASLLT